ncbi:MAG: 2,3-bisphosphoglycerate-dependent phosphoglycerate mutase [Gaiellaceae bacterium]|nr:2,3-bisphosphoglycerate-dependent phosphoglycerate mutase [Gaiellaceae bacterium]
MRLFLLTRHAHSQLNLEGRVNGDPSVEAALTDEGRAQAAQLGHRLAYVPIDLCVQTRFGRTAATADEILQGRDVPRIVEPLLDDIDVGTLEGVSIDEYRAWKRAHRRDEPFPRGESLDDAARRYAAAYDRLLARPEAVILVVCHEIPVRYAVNAAGGSDDLDGPEHAIPNAAPYLFDPASLERATMRIRELVH